MGCCRELPLQCITNQFRQINNLIILMSHPFNITENSSVVSHSLHLFKISPWSGIRTPFLMSSSRVCLVDIFLSRTINMNDILRYHYIKTTIWLLWFTEFSKSASSCNMLCVINFMIHVYRIHPT